MDLAKAEELFWQDGEVGEECSAWLIAEVKRLTVEGTELDGFRSALETRIETQREMMAKLQSSLTLSREEGRREGMMEGLNIAQEIVSKAMLDCCTDWTLDDMWMKLEAAQAAIRSEAKGERG